MKRLKLLIATCLLTGTLALGSLASAEVNAVMLAGTPHVSLSQLARSQGYSTSEAAGSLTVRTQSGVLVVFQDSPEALWRPAAGSEQGGEVSLSTPVVYGSGAWYAPEDVLHLLGMHLEGDMLVLQTSRRLSLAFPETEQASPAGAFETVQLGPGVFGLALYSSGIAGPDTLSMLLVDTALLSLALPEQQREVDAFMATVDRGRPLYFVLTALGESPWESELTVAQGGRSARLRYPNDLHVLQGETGTVGPDAPVSGVILLPEWINLRAAVTLRWGDTEAEFRFRR